MLSKKSGEALDKIVAGAEQAYRRMGEIASATVEQGQGSCLVRDAMTRVSDMIAQIDGATREQEKVSELIIVNVSRMKELTGQTKSSSREQSEVSKVIARNTEDISGLLLQIKRACDEQRNGSGQIMKSVEEIQDVTAVNISSTQVLNKSLDNLVDQAEVLKQEMSSFKVT